MTSRCPDGPVSPRRAGSIVILGIVAVVAMAAARGQESEPSLPWPFALAQQPFEQLGNRGYAPATFGLLEREDEAADLGPLQSMVPDLLAAALVAVGEHEEARRRDAVLRDLLGTTRRDEPPSFDGFTARPAVETILGLARGRRVVMFNEEHRSSRQRAFLHRLLEGLAAEGFTHLACETLAEDEALIERGYPIVASGTYSRDPIYGELLRRAVALGFHLSRYEATAEQRVGDPDPLASANRREAAQAGNLARLLEDESVRVVVFAGRHHIGEAADEWTPMASVLKSETGLDPLTVDLMLMEELARPELEHPARRAALEAGLLATGPVVLFDPSTRPYTPLPGSLDLAVFFPDSVAVAGRPDWLALGGLRRPVAPELDLAVLDGPALLQAIVEGEDEQRAVPADQVIVRPGEPPRPLLLREGRYLLRLLDRDGEVVWRGRTEV
jgi:hypothetical protein